MRWICKDEIEECLNEDWRNRSLKASAEIDNANSQDERKKILIKKSSQKIWRDFYKLLPETFKKKCWYCEAEDIRSDMPVDHFRPKGKINDDNIHEGYWWLAFSWDNYRCACAFCNSRRNFKKTKGGKANHFPLINPDKRAYSPTHDISEEIPNFLDPFDPSDFKLLWFDNDGLPEATACSTVEQKKKVSNSVAIFHLNEQRISRQRNTIRLDIKRRIDDIKSDDPTKIKNAKSYLRKITRDTEKLSRAACVYLSPYRYLPAVREILEID